jgi:hypothetical protein
VPDARRLIVDTLGPDMSSLTIEPGPGFAKLSPPARPAAVRGRRAAAFGGPLLTAADHLELTVTGQGDAIEMTGRVVGGSSTLQDARDALVQVSQIGVLEFQVTVRDQELIVDITISTP